LACLEYCRHLKRSTVAANMVVWAANDAVGGGGRRGRWRDGVIRVLPHHATLRRLDVAVPDGGAGTGDCLAAAWAYARSATSIRRRTTMAVGMNIKLVGSRRHSYRGKISVITDFVS
jgi:hypothetical protein